MSGPGVTSAWSFSFWIDVPVCDPPLGNDTHLPHSGRMHSCPNTLELTINAAKTTKPRIHFLLLLATDPFFRSHGRACPGHPRLSARARKKDVDARDKRGHDAGGDSIWPNLLDALRLESRPRGRAGEKFHECGCTVAIGGRSRRRRRIAGIILGISRQRSDELRALLAIELDLGDGAEADLLALAVDDVLHHSGAVRVARLLPLDLSADTEPVEQLFEIQAG